MDLDQPWVGWLLFAAIIGSSALGGLSGLALTLMVFLILDDLASQPIHRG